MNETKPWFESRGIWGGIAGVAIGLGIVAAAAAGILPADMAAVGVAQITAGVAAIVGRAGASKTIGG